MRVSSQQTSTFKQFDHGSNRLEAKNPLRPAKPARLDFLRVCKGRMLDVVQVWSDESSTFEINCVCKSQQMLDMDVRCRDFSSIDNCSDELGGETSASSAMQVQARIRPRAFVRCRTVGQTLSSTVFENGGHVQYCRKYLPE